jgi:hypothetical protein
MPSGEVCLGGEEYHAKDDKGKTNDLPLNERRTVPKTMTVVPTRMGRVVCSPRRRMARPVEINGLRLLIEAATGAPTLSMATKQQDGTPQANNTNHGAQ